LNTIDCFLNCTINEIISIFKEITMDIKVVRIEVNHSDKYGEKKILHVDDGTKWNVRADKPFYKNVVGPGIYDATFKEFQGHEYISYLKFKSAADGQNQATTNETPASGMVVAKGNYEAALKAKMDADKKRQDDIRLEFYCGVAKDILIANKKAGKDINHRDVLAIGLDLYKAHLEVLEMVQLQNQGKEMAKVSKTGTGISSYEKAEAAVEAAKDKEAEEEPPF